MNHTRDPGAEAFSPHSAYVQRCVIMLVIGDAHDGALFGFPARDPGQISWRYRCMSSFRPVLSKLLAVALGVVGITASSAAFPDAADLRPLSEQEFRQQIVGNTVEAAWWASRFRFWIGEDGVIRGQLGPAGADDGEWRIKDDLGCYEWTHYFEGVERCYRWYRSGDQVVLKNADAFRIRDIRGRLVPGKPKGY